MKNKSGRTWFSALQRPIGIGLIEAFLFVRGLLFLGRRYACPCCGWKFRSFVRGGASFRPRPLGYCPRCHAKARHRRDWLFLQEETDLFRRPLKLLHVSPEYCFSRRLTKMPNISYTGGDICPRPHADVRMDLTDAPFPPESFDAALCIHVLEHIEDDRRAMRELHRVLKPGGWALVSVPVRLDRPTYEDPAITTPEERERAFGETSHVRVYGFDLGDRLRECGFRVRLDPAKDIRPEIRARYGLKDDENIFFIDKERIG